MSRWRVHGERPLYRSSWLDLVLVDVELPDGVRFEHHAVRMRPAAGVVVVDHAREAVLLLWRHRFLTDTWGWEVPAGGLDAGEDPAAGAAREVLEETGWRPGPLTPLTVYAPANGVSDQRFHLFLADGAEHVGEPVDPHEAERVEWVPLGRVGEALRAGEVHDGLSVTALLWCTAFGWEPGQ